MPCNATPPRPTVVVACLGNEHRGDDAFGLLVAQRLVPAPPGVTVLAHRGDALSLIDAWRGADRVIIVDAIAAGLSPGTIVHLDLSAGPAPFEIGATSTHALGAGGVVEMARALGELPPRVDVLAVAGREFGVGAEPGREVASRVDEVAGRIRAMINEAGGIPQQQGESHA